MATKKAVHFGAGNIGRGFVGLLLHEAGYEVVFADVADALIDSLDAADSYTVRTVGQEPTETVVDGFRAVNSAKDLDALTAEIASADIVTTAVGVHILRFVAPAIAAGLAARPDGAPRAAVMACENAINATDTLEQEIRANFAGEDLDERALFANTAVDRIVPVQDPAAGLDVTVEDFHEWAVDRTPFQGEEPDVPGITWVDDLIPYIERKLFTVNTGHATTAWLGWAAGYATIADAIEDASVEESVRAVLAETSALLIAKHGFDQETLQAYATKVLGRFHNRALPDPVERVGRAPLRKLSRHDRIVGPAAELAERGLEATALLDSLSAALAFTPEGDEEAAQLQEILRTQDAASATSTITGLEEGHPLFSQVTDRISRRQSAL
ncbi:mannitol-1-phosphate 5-dehydrogenase [Brachybacterium endophyticum]|uniref:Mannitol-1-phosphate 5-dehydrogenase n=1 Tax=Brachybacterium endophyticum TaxID=2182385 RepID=A0A2U2RJX7_9MICO|nr:mannitol-1-phosphate 5-dehydrogenase [Brachybacterium endophyticum]PWH06182.1 mannitol-1-phosphate 5-dehydrogenase [Brachybacterium endophyticum]